jgi:hypothetical protein
MHLSISSNFSNHTSVELEASLIHDLQILLNCHSILELPKVLIQFLFARILLSSQTIGGIIESG